MFAERFLRATRIGVCIGLAASLYSPVRQAKANPWWTYGCVQAMQQKYGTRFEPGQLQSYCQCRDKGKRLSEECQHHLGISQTKNSPQRFSNEEEFTIGVMTAVICGKRLGKLDELRSRELLLSALSKQGFPLKLATQESLWFEAYKEVGSGLDWCRANQ